MNAKTNLNTSFLKIVACIAMLVDHVGDVFFPQYPIFRWIGRIAFPLFCYCLSVGLLYTHDIKKYLLRLGLFAVISQPFYVLAFHPNDFWASIADFNIFFTLFLCLLAVWGLKERKRKATRSMKISILCYNIGKSCVLQMRNGGLLWENVHLRT